MITFLEENILGIGIILVLAAVLIFLYARGNKKIVSKILYSLVTEAEKNFGGGTGEIKQASVICKLYEVLPPLIRLFISEKTLEAWVDKAVETAKERWAKNANIGNYIEKE